MEVKKFIVTHISFFLSSGALYLILFRVTDSVKHSIEEVDFWVNSLLCQVREGREGRKKREREMEEKGEEETFSEKSSENLFLMKFV